MITPAWKYQHTLSLSTLDCANLDSLTTSQREELQSALEALKRHNDKIEPAPQFPVVKGDFFQVLVVQGSGGALNMLGDSSGKYTTLSMHVVS